MKYIVDNKSIRITLSTLIVFLVVFISFNIDAKACVCAESSLTQKINSSDAVFSGKVIKAESVTNGTEFTFRVENVWKGILDKKVTVTSRRNSCEYYFKPGKKYIVFAYGEDYLRTSLCSGNHIYSFSRAKKLGKAKKV